MSSSVKFAISFPDKEFKELEAFRRERGISRSRLILEAITLWKEMKEKERLIKIYEEGYKRVPEDLRDREAWEKASLTSLSQEDW